MHPTLNSFILCFLGKGGLESSKWTMATFPPLFAGCEVLLVFSWSCWQLWGWSRQGRREEAGKEAGKQGRRQGSREGSRQARQGLSAASSIPVCFPGPGCPPAPRLLDTVFPARRDRVGALRLQGGSSQTPGTAEGPGSSSAVSMQSDKCEDRYSRALSLLGAGLSLFHLCRMGEVEWKIQKV